MKRTVLLVEDEEIMRVTLADALGTAGYSVTAFEKGREALDAIRDNSFDIVVTDIRLPDISGFDVLKEATRLDNVQVLVMTAYATVKDAVEAMKLGAFDYITKPFALDEFLLLMERAVDLKRLKEEVVRLKKDLFKCYSFPNIIGDSAEMMKVFSLIEKVAESDSSVLISGESGTGKELIASTIHYQSKRKDMPLIKVNCAALPEGLIESELFGHEKGAFTGAVKRKAGRFELADKGTLFLDEVGDISKAMQIKLLRVLQEGSFERLGGTETITVDVRIISATNRDIEKELEKGAFREDLYYRLNVIPITVPPLRIRRDDIPMLTEFFLQKYCNRLEKSVQFGTDAMGALMAYEFPGNVRELENIVERSVALSEGGTVGLDDLPAQVSKTTKSRRRHSLGSLSDVAARAEKEHIIEVLKSTKSNKTKSSELLGISRKTLWEKMNSYGIK